VMHALLVAASGTGLDHDVIRREAHAADLVIAADGGGALCLAAGVLPNVLVGDMDSLPAEDRAALEARGTTVIIASEEKDETDLELALVVARERGATQVTVAGASGGRLDHSLAAIGVLLMAADLSPRLVSAEGMSWLLDSRGRTSFTVPADAVFSVLALGGSARVDVADAFWPLRDARLETLAPLGVSNRAGSSGSIVTIREGSALLHLPADTTAQDVRPTG